MTFKLNFSKYTIFCFVYLGVLLGSILFQVESWPFSDFGVYKYSEHPAQTKIYRLGLEAPGAEPYWLFSGKEAIYNKFLHDPFFLLSETERIKWMESFLSLAKKRAGPNHTHLVMYFLTLHEEGEVFVPKSQAYLRMPLR